jgi:hypothetical protein
MRNFALNPGYGAGVGITWPWRSLDVSANLRFAFERLKSDRDVVTVVGEGRSWHRWTAAGPLCLHEIWWPQNSWGLRLFFETPLTRSEFVVAPVDWRLALKIGPNAGYQRVWIACGPFRLCSYTAGFA